MNSDDGTDCATGRATRPASPDRTEGGATGNRESDATQSRSSRTSGNNQWQQPVATVSHCRTSMTMAQTAPSPSRPPCLRRDGKRSNGAGPQPGTAKTVSLSANRLPAETAEPPVSGELAAFERCGRAESRPASRPGETPGPGRQRPPPFRAWAFGSVHRGASSTGETASGVRGNALPPTSLNSKTELRP